MSLIYTRKNHKEKNDNKKIPILQTGGASQRIVKTGGVAQSIVQIRGSSQMRVQTRGAGPKES